MGDKVEIFLSSIQMIKWKKWGSYYRNNIRNFCIVQGYDLETENVNQVASKMNEKNAHKSYIIVNFQNSRNKDPKSFQEENFFEKRYFQRIVDHNITKLLTKATWKLKDKATKLWGKIIFNCTILHPVKLVIKVRVG